jgi:SH3-like domain-containing protein
MSFRSLLLAALSILPFSMLPATTLLAQDSVKPPEVENSKFQFQGVVNSTSAFVFSGPGEGYYSTMKLEKDAPVTVVGIKFNWLKIVPPEGSFSYVGSVFVDRRGDGNVGRINRNDVNVRAGSNVNAGITTVQTQLSNGEDVQIIGKEGEYLKIKPPAGAYVYINKQFVDPVRAIGGNNAVATGDAAGSSAGAKTPVDNPLSANGGAASNETAAGETAQTNRNIAPSIEGAILTEAPTTRISGSSMASGATTNPSFSVASATTQPIDAPSADEQFTKFEMAFGALSKLPLSDQIVEPLIAQYQSIAKADGLSDTLKRVVELRIATLQVRNESKGKLAEARRLETEAAQKQLALQAEQTELQERLKQNDVQIFTAVGTLQPSSLQVGGGTLYRLTDPGTGRTVIYIRTTDSKVTSLMGQFIGVKGDAATDSELKFKFISPTGVEAVDPAKVNGSVAAQIIPPSMMARQAASVSN